MTLKCFKCGKDADMVYGGYSLCQEHIDKHVESLKVYFDMLGKNLNDIISRCWTKKDIED